jgi:hypothetical protein
LPKPKKRSSKEKRNLNQKKNPNLKKNMVLSLKKKKKAKTLKSQLLRK